MTPEQALDVLAKALQSNLVVSQALQVLATSVQKDKAKENEAKASNS